MFMAAHALRLMFRQARRSLATGLGVAIAAALLMSVQLFGTASGTTVTRRALESVPVDAQVLLAPSADAAAAQRLVAADPAVASALRFAIIHFDSAQLAKAGSATQTSAGVFAGIDAGYQQSTGLLGLSYGSLAPGEIAISRDLASNLGAVPGDLVSFGLPGGATVQVRVSGIVSTAGADVLLGPADAAHRAAGANPPANVALMDRATLEALAAANIPAGAVAGGGAVGGSGNAAGQPVLIPEAAVQDELHLRYDHAQMPGDPAAAQAWLDTVRRRLERAAAGAFTVADDASAALQPLAADLLWGQVLFIFLALPGLALALALARFAADATAEETRRHAALLRARGARPRRLAALFLLATAAITFLSSVVGAAAGVLVALALFRSDLLAAEPASAIVRAGATTVLTITAVATIAVLAPLRSQLRGEVAAGRQELQRGRAPLWERLYLDLAALVAAAVVFQVVGGSSQPVLTSEGNLTVTLALTSFVAPLLFWAGGTLLLLRVATRLFRRSGRLTGVLKRILGPGGELASHSLSARMASTARAVVLLALSVSFVTSILIFETTYHQQQRVDAELTLGADLKATPAHAVSLGAIDRAKGPGVASVSPMADRVVYVGSEAQDLLTVDPATLAATAPLSDSFFQGTSATAAMDALRQSPDAIFVSAETAKDYTIVPGDRVRIRIPDTSGVLRSVDFHMAGVALEFPTAPKDAFLVANLAYVAAQTGNDRISFVLARSDGDVSSASRALAARLGSDWSVTDLGSITAKLANGITSVDLATLVALDVAFGVLIASLGVALFLLAGLSERRRELATLAAVGAEPAQLRAALSGETIVVGVAGLAAGVLMGSLVGFLLLQVLAGVFDPPADLPAMPWLSLAGLAAAVALALGAALLVADRSLARLNVLGALRER
jgi:putative ABC transport system permease protein